MRRGIEGRMFQATVLTLFSAMFPGPLGQSLAAAPAGGGPGMVMRADVLAAALDAAAGPEDPRPRLLMSPRGRPFSQRLAREWASGPGIVALCARFEGVDERIIEGRGLVEVSIGDYVLSGGEIAALAILDACIRLIPGVMGKLESGDSESF